MTARNADFEETWVFGVTLGVNPSSVIPEEVRNVPRIRRLHDQLEKKRGRVSAYSAGENSRTHSGSLGLPDLDIPMERLWVHKHLVECGDGHDLRYRAKVESALVLEQPQIV